MSSQQNVEVPLYRFLSAYKGRSLLLAVSGGLDSMALFYSLFRLAPKHNISLSIAHIHHGWTADQAQMKYRNECFSFVKALCVDHKLPFFSNIQDLNKLKKQSLTSKSEAELRSFRLQELQRIFKHTACDFVVFAHHADDLLETRLIRLIRGTGGQGLKAMRSVNGHVLRPLLAFSKKDLEVYVQSVLAEKKPPFFLEDPSNQSTQYLRNWIRLKWLPLLEKRRIGAVKNLAASLETLTSEMEQAPSLDFCFEKGKILRSEYYSLPETDQRRVWALYLKQQGLKNYGLSHIRELSKRLDVGQKDLTFRLLKKRWLANARHIWCESENAIE